MRRSLLTLVILAGLSGSAFAETITTTVNGMVCAFCATGIEKTFRKQPEVATVKLDLHKKLVTITTRPGKTPQRCEGQRGCYVFRLYDGENRSAKVTTWLDFD